MQEFKGHIITDDLYYFILSYLNKTKYEFLFQCNENNINKNITEEQLIQLIQKTVEYNTKQIIYEKNITLKDIQNLTH